jgi:hypothetical protein
MDDSPDFNFWASELGCSALLSQVLLEKRKGKLEVGFFHCGGEMSHESKIALECILNVTRIAKSGRTLM